jgi:arginine decarboxylase
MRIHVTSGTGTGGTSLAAFHEALEDAGIGRYNIIELSSIVPPEATVSVDRMSRFPPGKTGDRLYCVLAKASLCGPEDDAFVGLGWVYGREGGLLVEHTGESRQDVASLIGASLRSAWNANETCASRGKHIVQAQWTAPYSCAVVAAVFASEAWPAENETGSADRPAAGS